MSWEDSCSKVKKLILLYQLLQDTIFLDSKGHIFQYKVQAGALEGKHLSRGGKEEGYLPHQLFE